MKKYRPRRIVRPATGNGRSGMTARDGRTETRHPTRDRSTSPLVPRGNSSIPSLEMSLRAPAPAHHEPRCVRANDVDALGATPRRAITARTAAISLRRVPHRFETRLMRRVHERRRCLAGEINEGHRTTRTVRSVVAPTPVRAACVGSRSPSPLTILGEDTPWHSVAAGSAVERRTRTGHHSSQSASDARPAGPVRELA
jgi:hypothetical protein